MPTTTRPTRYWVTRPMGYGPPGADRQYDRGQLIELAHLPNDKKLLDYNYIQALEPDVEVHTCAECGAEFVGIAERTAHGDRRHATRELTPIQEDERFEREERILAQVAPVGPPEAIKVNS
jgi:hypothetical protein